MVPCLYTENEELNNGLLTTISRIKLSDINTSEEHTEEAYMELLGTGIFVAGQKVLEIEEVTSIYVEHFNPHLLQSRGNTDLQDQRWIGRGGVKMLHID